MKTEILSKAIRNRNKVRFYYSLRQMVIDPYLISTDRTGTKTIYGKVENTDSVERFEFKKIYNIRVLETESFAPRIMNITRYN
ncbi:MAG: hypothetical protein LC102_02350 [Ignavibacteriales bacterium]|nr:MAG: hypothetical protein F9K26_01750 [Ignavibacteriaceae bacterium]MBW7872162.1 hypothetical protein [Ignavibacteria bacterium]MCZ2142254.1 hypothetical protein [Ignavibacteriales bacterium]OQY78800.1 MAG: hypothetical protein B6D45_01790 [Ignavibacteriales bacterium UTCHB3]MBV6445693.1 hypothetical protein [Ignavibacteriaceae bacterium]